MIVIFGYLRIMWFGLEIFCGFNILKVLLRNSFEWLKGFEREDEILIILIEKMVGFSLGVIKKGI